MWRFLSEDDFMVTRIVFVFASAVPIMTLSFGQGRTSILIATIVLLAEMFVVNVILGGIRNRNEDFLVGFACLISIGINLSVGLA